MSVSEYSWQDLEKRAGELARRRIAIDARRKTDESRRQKLLKQSLAAQARIDVTETVKDVLETIQHQAHERAVGTYEQILSALLADVLPGEREVVLDLHTERGAPAMNVFIRKGEDSPLEDAWLGTGGSVTNLLSTGLRLVALMRSGRRRFMVLDESDCWIKPELVSKYAAVVAQMARELEVQVLMISHHDESLFADHIPNRLKMEKVGKTIVVEWSANSDVPTWSPEDEGMRSIGLFDFQAHQNTVVPLAQGVTLLQGDNDIGKSSIVNALRALFDGSSNDTFIRHHAERARVEIDLGDKLLTWVRNKKGKVKVSYTMVSSKGGQTLHASVGTAVPEWLIQEVGIGKVDDLDIQIGQQQDPVFLLNQPASKRAKALAVGQESGHIQMMMTLDRQEQTNAKSTIKQAESEMEELRFLELYSRKIIETNGPENEKIQEAHKREKTLDTAHQILDDWAAAQHILDAGNLTTKPPILPPLHGDGARLVWKRWTNATQQHNIRNTLKNGIDIAPPKLHGLNNVKTWARWSDATERRHVLSKMGHSTTLAPKIHGHNSSLIFERWKKSIVKTATMSQIASTSSPEKPRLIVSEKSVRLKEVWGKAEAKKALLQEIPQSSTPKLPKVRLGMGENVISRWKLAYKKTAILSNLNSTSGKISFIPPALDVREIKKNVSTWKHADTIALNAENELKEIASDEEKTRLQMEEIPSTCAACGQRVNRLNQNHLHLLKE